MATKIYPKKYNPLNYGATGNGTDDDTVAIQDTIQDMQTAGSGCLHIPGGYTFKVTPQGSAPYCNLISSSRIWIEGQGRIARAAANVDTFHFQRELVVNDSQSNLNDIHIEGVYFNPLVQSGNSYAEIFVKNARSVIIDNIQFGRMNQRATNLPGFPTNVPASEESKIGTVIKMQAVGTGIITDIRGFGLHQFLHFNGTYDVNVDRIFVDADRIDAQMCYVTGGEANWFTNSDYVNSKGADNVTPLNNITAQNMIFDGGSNFSRIHNVYFDTCGNGVVIRGNCMGLVFDSCWTSSRPGIGAQVVAKDGAFPHAIVFNNCDFVASGKEGLRIEGGNRHRVTNNRFANSGYVTAGLACFYAQDVANLIVKDNVGAADYYGERVGSAGGANKGIHLHNCTNVRRGGNDFDSYATPMNLTGTTSIFNGTNY